MKKLFSVLGYFIISVFLFLGGVLLEAVPPQRETAAAGDMTDDRDDKRDDESSDDDTDGPDADLDPADEKDEAQEVSEYYYSILDETKKEYYDQIKEAVKAGDESVMLPGITYEEADPVFVSVQYDHPEYFWVEGSYTYKSGDGYVEFIFNYNCTGEEREKRKSTIEQASEDILAAAPLDGTDYEKVKYVFETLVDRTQYDLEAPDNQNIYSVFGNWTSVCAGYAKATKYLLDQMGVDSIYVTGDAEGESHAWNIVSCGGQYYCVDTTWGDPVYQEGIGVDVETTSYEYLCCPDSMLSRTHTADSTFALPECTDNSLEYYRLQGRYLEAFDQEAVLDIMKNDIDTDAERTDIQFSEPEAYNQAMSQMEVLVQEAMKYEESVKGSTGGVRWQYNENTCLISVLWAR